MALSSPHTWRFFSAGGFDQVRLDTGADLLRLDSLDQKLWVALSCPVQGLEFDPRTLALIDSDGDGHIRAPELIAAIQWAAARLQSPETLVADGPLPLAAIADGTDEGKRLLASARHILESLGKPEADTISVEDVADNARLLAGMAFNGDGVIAPASSTDPALSGAIAEIIERLGGVVDRGGEAGLDQDTADRFFGDARAWADWRDAPGRDAALCPLGEATEAGQAALAAVRAKIDDWFTRCRLAAFDVRAGELMNGSEEEFKALSARNLAEGLDAVAALPLARVEAGAALPLVDGLNPGWQAAVAAFRDAAVRPLLGERNTLSAAEWEDIKARFAPFEDWQAARPQTPLADLDPARLQELLDPAVQAGIDDLLARDRALAGEAEASVEVERLVRYARDLHRLANNFAAFRDFYTGGKAVFQAGTLYLDGRSCELCVKVLDPGKHAVLASLSGVYLAYCDCVRGGEKMTVAAAFTAGDSDQLMVGRNGVFYDRDGRDWDATITKIVDHPISIRQAFWAPYKKLARLVGEQLQKFAAAKAKMADDLAAKAVTDTGAKAEAGKAPAPAAAPAAFDAARFAGIFAAIGLAIGAVGTALASVVTGFLGLKFWQMPLAVGGLMLLISGPSMAMAYFKLRNRNLGPLLDANGWAVNARARINIPFGTALTRTARLPAGAERALGDPYAERPSHWKLYLVLGAALAGLLYYLATAAGR